MALQGRFLLVLLMSIKGSASEESSLPAIINELNAKLNIETNVVYNPYLMELDYLNELKPLGQMIVSSLSDSAFNVTKLVHNLNENVLFILHVKEPSVDFFEHLKYHFQEADFLLIPDQSSKSELLLEFAHQAWHLGYGRLLFLLQKQVYVIPTLPHIEMQLSNVENYIANRNRSLNLHGLEVRVAVYFNAPRAFFHEDKDGKRLYGGYYLRFMLEYLDFHNGTFVPVFTTNNSAMECIKALHANRVDTCADALAYEADRSFAVTLPIRIPYANIMVRFAKPLSSHFYLIAPFSNYVWSCLIVYVVFMVCFMSYIHWRQQGRWIFSTFLLEVISSLLFTGFSLKDLHGRERYILFGVLFIAGFIYSTFYLGSLKSMLTTEVFDPQITSFEQLVESNTTIMIDEYDFYLSKRYNLPDLLWPLVKVVSNEELKEHRTFFDQDYAYLLFSDRMHLYDNAQKYLKHPRFRRIPINIFHLFVGFPMRSGYFMVNSLSRSWSNVFESGLLQKLSEDADREIIMLNVDSYKYLATEYYEVLPLDLDYFVMPAMSLALGYVFALLTFVIELTVWRMRGPPSRNAR